MAVGRFNKIILGTGLAGTDNGDDTVTLEATGGSSDPADDALVWMPLADSDGILVLDADDAVIPTLVPL